MDAALEKLKMSTEGARLDIRSNLSGKRTEIHMWTWFVHGIVFAFPEQLNVSCSVFHLGGNNYGSI